MENYIQLTQNAFTVCVNDKTVTVDRSDITKTVEASGEAIKKVQIINFLGVFNIGGKQFAAASTSVSNVAEFWGINKVDNFVILQITPGPVNSEAESLLKQGLSLSTLYFSNKTDLSLNLRLLKQKSAERKHFIWNGIARENFEKAANVENFVQPVMAGFVTTFKAEKFTFVLISRRSAVNAGTRFWMRGSDAEGNVANFVETEQIIETEKETFSFVQIRGSVPFHWSQYPDLSRLPNLRLASLDENEAILNKHFKKLTDEYGRVIAVSLTDKKGRELELTNTYNELGAKAENVQYQYFDFHKECAHMKYENINNLIKSISEGLEAEQWTELNTEKNQNGVVRTNCVDCLDRTNVVQSSIARIILEKQLKQANCECAYDAGFRNAWTDNADFISCQYSGTPALKTDFTRTGKRTKMGALNDGKNSIMRFYINTCTDGTRQDAYDVVTQAVPTENLQKEGFFIALIMFFFMLISALILTIKGKKAESKKTVLAARMRLVNHPRFRETIPAEKHEEKKE